MATSVERSDSQRSQSNGPRVSFNRDVHVKRIGLRPNELQSYQLPHANHSQSAQLRRELPKDLSKEGILKEAALVLSQAEKVKCVAEGGSDITGGRVNIKSRGPIEKKTKIDDNPDRFNSLPTRKKKRNIVDRSSSDASTKKYKKPSIFNIFSRKSESNLDQVSQKPEAKKLTRAKSDVSDSKGLRPLRKLNSSETDDSVINLKKKAQLSPIIENSQQEKSLEKNEKLVKQKPRKGLKLPPVATAGGTVPAGNIGFTNEKDLDLVPSKPHSEISSHPVNSTSPEGIHSSQLPPKKPPLTKGLTVDGMVKRLSMDRFSPPPQLHGPAFSYTRPNDYVVYARVAYDQDAKSKQTVHSRYTKSDSSQNDDHNGHDTIDSKLQLQDHSKRSDMASQTNVILYKNIDNHERSLSPVQHLKRSPGTYERSTSPAAYFKHSPDRQVRSFSPVPPLRRSPHRRTDPIVKTYPRGHSDEDEGVGLDLKHDHEEPPIIPNISANRSHLLKHSDSIDRSNEFNDLSHRRRLLESRITSRKVGSMERLLDKEKTPPSNDPIGQSFQKEYTPTDERINNQNRYHREMSIGVDGVPTSKEFQIRNRLSSPSRYREIDLGYIEDSYTNQNKESPLEPDTSYFQEKYRQEFEPKSLESEFCDLSRSLPESYMIDKYHQDQIRREPIAEHFYQNGLSSLKREKKKHRYLDKGDSGIENDFRKDPYGDDPRIRWKYRTIHDDMEDTDMFLKRERQHTEMLHMKRYNYIFRERSIDDGSHFDPRLDKYPRYDRSVERIRREEKKIGGLEKVKQLFTLKKKPEIRNEKLHKDKYMVQEEEMRKRYKEYRSNDVSIRDARLQTTDIALRRRLSTPKASPLPKRSPSQKSSKSSNVSVQTDKNVQKPSWFKSLDRLSRKKTQNSSKSNSLITDDSPSTLKSTNRVNPIRNTNQRDSEKNLRFFGDTDAESIAPHVKTSTANNILNRIKKPIINPTLMRHQKYSQSANALNNTQSKSKEVLSAAKYRSTSLHNIDNEDDTEYGYSERNISSAVRSPEHHNASDSTTRSNDRHYPDNYDSSGKYSRDYSEQSYAQERGRPRERSPWSPQNYHYDRAASENRKPPTGPQKPARAINRRKNLSRDRERIHDSSGTEGDSSQQSQRSVVYLHATTVGSIPQPYIMNTRRTTSRDDLSSSKSKKLEPMTKTVSRSFSVLAPWKPKHLSEGYEIHYSPAHEPNLQPMKSKKDRTSSLTRNRRQTSKDDLQSIRNSSITSNSSTLPYRNKEREVKKPILTRHRRKE